jgi:peptidoglycan biosynthesis protein MviN/MurJ (putative lipid II flippase)
MTDGGDEIAKLSRAIELSRTVCLVAMAVLVVAAFPLLAVLIGNIGFEPVPIASVLAALGIGIAFLAWRRRRLTLMAGILKIAEAHKDELAESP